MRYKLIENSLKDNRIRCFIAGIIGAVCSLITLGLMLEKADVPQGVKNRDVVCVIVSCITFFAVTVCSYLVLLKIDMDCLYENRNWGCIVCVIFGMLTVWLAYGLLINDTGYVGADVSGFWWHRIPPQIVIVILVLVSLFFIYAVLLEKDSKVDNRIILYLYYGVMSVVYAGTVVYLNVFAGDLYHIDAYVHPIYSVFYNTPYSDASYSLYGHYELFYKLPMLIFGTSPRVICVILALIAFAQEIIVLHVIDKLTESKIIKIAAPIAMLVPTGCMFVSSSYQSTPHRTIFPAILILYGMQCMEKQDFGARLRIVGNIICTLAIIWNTETGAVCCIAWFVYSMLRILQKADINAADVAKNIGAGILFILVDVFLAVLYVNIYNFCVGGGIFIKGFFYPYINGGFMDHYDISVQFSNVPYIYILVLSLGAITYGASKTSLFLKNACSKNAALIALTGTVLLGQLLYYVSRAAYYGLLTTFPFAFILISFFSNILAQGDISRKEISVYNAMRYSIGGISASCIAVLLCMSGILGEKYADSFSAGRYDIVDYKTELAEFKDIVEKDTYAVGWGADEIYGILGWDAKYHMLGTTDVLLDPEANRAIYDLLYDAVNKESKVLLSDAAYKLLNIDYAMLDEFRVLGGTYGYFERCGYTKSSYVEYGEPGVQAGFLMDSCHEFNGYLGISGYVYGMQPEENLNEVKLAIRNINTGKIFRIDTQIQVCEVIPENFNEIEYYATKKVYGRVLKDELGDDLNTWEIVLVCESESVCQYVCTGILING